MSLEGDCYEVEVTPNLEFLIIFGMSLEGVYHELVPNSEASKNSLKKAPT
jgi:hypothetical protein